MVFPSAKTKDHRQLASLNRLLIILGLVLAGLGLLYIVQVSNVVSLGYTFEDLKKTSQESSASVHLLQAQVTQLPPEAKLQKIRAQLQLTQAKEIRYIKAGRSMSISQR